MRVAISVNSECSNVRACVIAFDGSKVIQVRPVLQGNLGDRSTKIQCPRPSQVGLDERDFRVRFCNHDKSRVGRCWLAPRIGDVDDLKRLLKLAVLLEMHANAVNEERGIERAEVLSVEEKGVASGSRTPIVGGI